MKILVDTCIVIDVLQKREPFGALDIIITFIAACEIKIRMRQFFIPRLRKYS